MHSHTTRPGLILFAIYLVLYGGFVALAVIAPDAMEQTPLAGLNLAVLYGFGLILAAMLLAVVYGLIASRGPGGADEREPRE